MEFHLEKVVDETGARVWHAIDEVCVPFDHPGLLADPLEELAGQLPDGPPSERRAFYVAYTRGVSVGIGSIKLPMADNLHLASVVVSILPRFRRQGYGRRMFEHLHDECRAAGRTTLVGQVGAPLDSMSAGELFAKGLGARPVLKEMRSELKFAMIERDALTGLEEQARARSDGYTVLQWIDHAPDDVLEDAARLAGHFVTEAPMGELNLEAERWDAARIREWEHETVGRGRMRASTGALHAASNHLVACSEIAVSRSRPRIAYQWGTLVEPEHRGHRLGLLIKIANLQLLERELPAVETVQTWTATDNAYMIAINEAIGYRAVEKFAEWQMEI